MTVIAQIGRAVFGEGTGGDVLFAMLQLGTLLILVLAANTAFADFPRLASFQAGDRFLPRQLMRYGDRLVYSNGIIVLSVVAALLVVVFKASVTKLIPLYAVGVFTSFTFSQAGMAKRHRRLKEPGWRRGLAHQRCRRVVSARDDRRDRRDEVPDGAWLILVAIPVIWCSSIRIHGALRQRRSHLRDPDRRPERADEHHVVLLVGKPSAAETARVRVRVTCSTRATSSASTSQESGSSDSSRRSGPATSASAAHRRSARCRSPKGGLTQGAADVRESGPRPRSAPTTS